MYTCPHTHFASVFIAFLYFMLFLCYFPVGMIEGNNEYNEQLVIRLHKVLRPFLLRRLKMDVERQMPKKYEHVILCRLSKRQRYLYDDFMSLST